MIKRKLGIDGLVLYENFIPKSAVDTLYSYIDNLTYMKALNRPVQHYGYIYDYNIREPCTKNG